MMKYFGTLAIIAALIGTWHLSQLKPSVSMEVHAALQDEVRNIIRNYIQTHLPTARHIQFMQLYTSTVNPNRVKASFQYSFDSKTNSGDTAHQVFVGDAFLDRLSKTAGPSQWSLDEVNARTTSLDYKNGSHVLANPGDTASGSQPNPVGSASGTPSSGTTTSPSNKSTK